MGRRDAGLALTPKEITGAFADPAWAGRFPPLLTTRQAVELLQIPLQTLYAWSSAGYLKGCCRRNGKRLFFFRDRLISKLFNEGFDSDD